MELRATAQLLRRWWWLIAIPTLIAGLAALPALSAATGSTGGYSTVLHFSAAQNPQEQLPAESDLQDVWLASELTVNALSAWARTESFRREVSSAPGIVSGDSDALGIAADHQRSIGQLFLSHPDSQALARIANAAIHVLQTQNRKYFPQLGDETATVTVLDTPTIVPVPVSLSLRLAPLLRVALGFCAGLVLAMLAYAFDPALRRREDVEALGLAVLAVLPREKLR